MDNPQTPRSFPLGQVNTYHASKKPHVSWSISLSIGTALNIDLGHQHVSTNMGLCECNGPEGEVGGGHCRMDLSTVRQIKHDCNK